MLGKNYEYHDNPGLIQIRSNNAGNQRVHQARHNIRRYGNHTGPTD
jgi:hypothetical protein